MAVFNVALNKDVDYDQFWEEIETEGLGCSTVPTRAVEVIKERETSLRQCWYDLTAEEADLLRQDPRVYCVETPVELRDDIEIQFFTSSQTGLYYKVAGFDPANTNGINWGLFRLSSRTNNTPGDSGILTYEYDYDGTGVDVVIMDSGCQIDHPEFTDANGDSRIQQINWYTESGVQGTMPDFNLFYIDEYGHGTHCAGVAAGKTYGRAKNSRIYIMNILTLPPQLGTQVGIPLSDAYDCIKGWHNNKPIDPVTGYKRPTVVNLSFGTVFRWDRNLPWQYFYRGSLIDVPANTNRQTQFGLVGSGTSEATRFFAFRNDNTAVDIQELIDAGVILVGAAANFSQTISVPGEVDYDNYIRRNQTGFLPVFHMRGPSPGADPGVICVGAIDTEVTEQGVEKKVDFSESGPRVDIYAPGTNIVSAVSTINAYGVTAQYPSNTNFRIASLSGTSFACPNVVGIIAQMLQRNPSLSPAQVRQQIIMLGTNGELFDTVENFDYANTASLHGGPNNYAFFDPVIPPTALDIDNQVEFSGPINISF
jgi:subtilisin family serine protease